MFVKVDGLMFEKVDDLMFEKVHGGTFQMIKRFVVPVVRRRSSNSIRVPSAVRSPQLPT